MSTLKVNTQVNIGSGTPNVTITSSNNQLTLTGNASDVKVEGIADDPSSNQDAVNRKFIDSNTWKTSVRAATTASISINSPGTTSIDGLTIVDGDRVLVKNQGSPSQNGIYIYRSASTDYARTNDAQSGYNAFGVIVYVNEGTSNGGILWKCTTNANFNSSITFTQFLNDSSPGGSNTQGQYTGSGSNFEGTSDLTYVTGTPDTLNIGIGSATALINIGTNTSQSGAVKIGSGSSVTSVTSLGGATINIGNSNTSSTINIATDTSHSGNVNILSGTSATGTLNLGNSNTSSLVNYKGTNILTGLSLRRTSNILVSNATDTTMVPDGSPAEWTNGTDAPTVNFSTGVITINRNGLYYVFLSYGLVGNAASNSNRRLRSWVKINGSSVLKLCCQYQCANTGDTSSPIKLSSSGYLVLNNTDTVEFMINHTYGTNRNACDSNYPGDWGLILVPGS